MPILNLDILREILLNLAVDLVQVFICKTISGLKMFGFQWIPLEHLLESVNAIDDFLFTIASLGCSGVFKKESLLIRPQHFSLALFLLRLLRAHLPGERPLIHLQVYIF